MSSKSANSFQLTTAPNSGIDFTPLEQQPLKGGGENRVSIGAGATDTTAGKGGDVSRHSTSNESPISYDFENYNAVAGKSRHHHQYENNGLCGDANNAPQVDKPFLWGLASAKQVVIAFFGGVVLVCCVGLGAYFIAETLHKKGDDGQSNVPTNCASSFGAFNGCVGDVPAFSNCNSDYTSNGDNFISVELPAASTEASPFAMMRKNERGGLSGSFRIVVSGNSKDSSDARESKSSSSFSSSSLSSPASPLRVYTGMPWQCVEYARRFLISSPVLGKYVTFESVDGASDIFYLPNVTSIFNESEYFSFISYANGVDANGRLLVPAEEDVASQQQQQEKGVLPPPPHPAASPFGLASNFNSISNSGGDSGSGEKKVLTKEGRVMAEEEVGGLRGVANVIPVFGDLIIYPIQPGGFPFGHVAVVSYVDTARMVVGVAEQNWNNNVWPVSSQCGANTLSEINNEKGDQKQYAREIPLIFDNTTGVYAMKDKGGVIKGWKRVGNRL